MDRLSVKTKAIGKYYILFTFLTGIHFFAEYVHYRLCARTFPMFVMSSGSPMCQGIKGISALTMEKFLTYLT